MRVLGLDYGLKRVGVAFLDTEVGIAFGRETITYDTSAELIGSLRAMRDAEAIEKIVVGMPYSMDQGGENEMSAKARAFGELIADALTVPVEYFDERLSSRQASARLRQQGFKAKEQKGKIDTLAAQQLLTDWFSRGG